MNFADRTVVVHKYGGTSLASDADLFRAAHQAARAQNAGNDVVVVVSARGHHTDHLVEMATQVAGPPVPDASYRREMDQVLATGECLSAALMALALQRIGVAAISMTAGQAGIMAGGLHQMGVIESIDTDALRLHLAYGRIVVVTGFQGVTTDGSVVTLGRGGSDTTAVALAVALGAARCEIHTDVSGVYTADPRVEPQAWVMDRVDAGVMTEMAFAGARVLHPRAVELAAANNLDLLVRSSTLMTGGTVVTATRETSMLETDTMVCAVVHDADVALVVVESNTDPTGRILDQLARRSVPVDLLARATVAGGCAVGFTVCHDQLPHVRRVLDAMDGPEQSSSIAEGLAKVSVVGNGLLSRPAYASQMLRRLEDLKIQVHWIAMAQMRISAVIPLESTVAAVGILHEEFELYSQALVPTSA